MSKRSKTEKMDVEDSPDIIIEKRPKKLSWSEKCVELVKSLNEESLKEKCVPFILDNVQLGLIPPDVLKRLEAHQDVFIITKDLMTSEVKFVTMSLKLTDRKTRSQKFACVLRDWKDRDYFPTLRGWRNETYEIKTSFSAEPMLDVERSACCLFGFRMHGAHINGYVRNDSGDVYMWISRRSKDKQTFPGKLDNTVAGGISSGETVKQTVIRECSEEAGISEKLCSNARPAGIVSYLYADEEGVHPEVQFVFDLELPRSFEPQSNDKEVSDFYLLPIKEVKELIATDEFKPNSALVLLDFFIRHGAISPDEEPNYMLFNEGCRKPLPY